MNKSPAFQFYPGDFVSGAPAFMRPLETHVYVWLLCLEWSRNGFEFDEADLASWCRIPVGQFRQAWAKVSASFVLRDGRYFNPRLDSEREKQQRYSERMAENGKKGGRPKAEQKPQVSRGLADDKPSKSISVLSSTLSSKEPTASASADVDAVLARYIALHPRRRIGKNDPQRVRRALAMGYSAAELCEALEGNAGDEWHAKKSMHGLEYVLRNHEKIDTFRGMLESSRPRLAVDPVTRLPNAVGLLALNGGRQ